MSGKGERDRVELERQQKIIEERERRRQDQERKQKPWTKEEGSDQPTDWDNPIDRPKER